MHISAGTSGGQKRAFDPLKPRAVCALTIVLSIQPHWCSLGFQVSEPVSFVNMHGNDTWVGLDRKTFIQS